MSRFVWWYLGCGLLLIPYLWGGLVWDDHLLLSDGLWQLESIGDIWGQSVQGGLIATQYYRPIPMTIMALVPSVFGLHLITWLVHLGTGLLVYRWIETAFEQQTVARIAAAFFLLHPIQSEVLGWVSCLPDILAVHFGLWAVVLVQRASSGVLVALALLVGMLCKEIAVVPIIAYGLCNLTVSDLRRPPLWLLVSMGTIVVIWLLRRWLGVETVLPPGFDDVFWVSVRTIGAGWFGLAIPYPLVPVRDVWVLPLWQVGLGWLLCLTVLFNAKVRMGWLIVIGALCISLPPVWVGYLAAERYLYLASLGWVWIVSVYLVHDNRYSHLQSNRWRPTVFALCVLLGYGHWTRAMVWSSDQALFSHATDVLPHSGYAWHLSGMHHAQKAEFSEATDCFLEATTKERHHHQSAEFYLRSALESDRVAEAFQFAEQGPKVGLSRGYLEVWLQLAQKTQATERVQELQSILAQ